ncbi:helix-turn-helix domain-containing protein [Actinomadura sp. CNU-125]|uniref:helix-turn-helix domain-containing protein n=1 Tax=Actinomadura sp. CNU-125 TaxID=1904961 RepID=UPI000B2C8E01|nr:helix-turn-helix domain-containing protein [Actinomadura sp. CNU-125]
MDGTWTIGELADRATAALADHDSPPVNGRVRDLPNERLIRWYTTIGLIDPPLGRRGRTALYGRRHLLQLVAVKRRQATGRSIAEIQVELPPPPTRRWNGSPPCPPPRPAKKARPGKTSGVGAPTSPTAPPP